jgi:hypothetical protein
VDLYAVYRPGAALSRGDPTEWHPPHLWCSWLVFLARDPPWRSRLEAPTERSQVKSGRRGTRRHARTASRDTTGTNNRK